jgi:hypothetical protein
MLVSSVSVKGNRHDRSNVSAGRVGGLSCESRRQEGQPQPNEGFPHGTRTRQHRIHGSQPN